MILVIKNVIKEGPGSIAEFFNDLRIIELEKGGILPSDINEIEAVFIMGGPMNVYEEDKYPMLKNYDKFIKMLIKEDIPLIGICLGAQLLAKACGAKVYKAATKEVGWRKVELTEDGLKDPLFNGLPKSLSVLQWHEDTFDVPENATLLAAGTEVQNQAFRVGNCAYGLQFHIEVTKGMIQEWFKDEADKYEMDDETRYKKQAGRMYKNFLHLSAQKLGNFTLYKKVIGSVEKKLIENVLQKTEGNQIHASEILGINRNTLRTKIRKLGIGL